jgi:hypothetical protein
LPTDWRTLCEVDLVQPPSGFSLGDAERFFSISKRIDSKFGDDEKRVVEDVLSLSLTRLGLLAPSMTEELHSKIHSVCKADGIILIPDSNVLYNGTLHWLLRVLRSSAVWILPFVVSLTQLQQSDARLKSLARNTHKNNLRQALRSRAFINASLGLLERNRRRYQVVELDPSLLRYLRAGAKAATDPDESDVLEDRLLIEGIHSILRATRTRATQLVLTSDVMLARILDVEGIRHLFIPSPKMGDETINCLHYNSFVKGFVGTTLRTFLWDTAQTFGTIRLDAKSRQQFSLSTYWPGKLPSDWTSERLLLDPPSPLLQEHSDALSSSSDVMEISGEILPQASDDRTIPESMKELSKATLPQASLPQILRLAGAVKESAPAPVPEILARINENDRPTEGTSRRGFEILRRMALLTFDGQTIRASADLDQLDSLLRNSRLDEISDLFKRFRPYAVLLERLRNRHKLERSEIDPWLRRTLDPEIGKESSVRLSRYHVLLGQAWTDGDAILDGSQRPESSSFVQGFESAFAAKARDGLAKVSELLPETCRTLRMSPWAAAKAISLLADGPLSNYSFQPAVGGRPTGRDQVISGSLHNVLLVNVPTDRVFVGGRPVLTISGMVR